MHGTGSVRSSYRLLVIVSTIVVLSRWAVNADLISLSELLLLLLMVKLILLDASGQARLLRECCAGLSRRAPGTLRILSVT